MIVGKLEVSCWDGSCGDGKHVWIVVGERCEDETMRGEAVEALSREAVDGALSKRDEQAPSVVSTKVRGN